eukprot:jgi/Botrbrau1/15382/Bobra.43_2s0012.2
MGRTKNWDDSMHSIGQIILIRHAEKEKFDKNEAKGTDNGEDVENHLLKDRKEKNENLSYKGVCRAEFLATYFMEANKPFNTPDVLYAMQQKGPGSSNRPFQTIAPLARRLGVNVRMPQTREYVRDLVEEILYDSNPASTILICWEHKWLIPMANYFGIPAKAWSDSPLDKSSNDDRNYHTVWVITPLEEGLNFAVRIPDCPCSAFPSTQTSYLSSSFFIAKELRTSVISNGTARN